MKLTEKEVTIIEKGRTKLRVKDLRKELELHIKIKNAQAVGKANVEKHVKLTEDKLRVNKEFLAKLQRDKNL